ncbi:OpgC domain-containing protein [Devosia sp. 2618]|uniref:OpgC family protein n=1 Tax=Devosia sp. 2618 TaxID=3156454 RepID=UPI003391220A
MLQRSPELDQAVKAVPGVRDARLDMFRGIALVMIFINHVPGTLYENYTSRNFGFSDAAEAFVFMSGMAAGLAYSGRFRSGPIWLAITKVWARARQLYFVHLTITLLSLAIFAAAALWFDQALVLTSNNVNVLFEQPLATIIGIPLLSHQLGYLNILPLYVTLLLATPLFLVVGLRWPWLVLGGSILLWVIAGQFRFNLPNFPMRGGWFFNPFSWQVLFVVGLLSGVAMKQGKRFIPYIAPLFWLAVAFLLYVLVWMKVPAVGEASRGVLSMISAAGAPFYVTWFDKTFLSLPRLLHAFALFYVLGSVGAMTWVAQCRIAAPFRLLGRQGLAVFATGTVISMGLQAIKLGREPDPVFDGLILAGGLAALLALAWILSRTAEIARSPRSSV